MAEPQQISVRIADAPEVIALLKRAERELLLLRAALVLLVGVDGEHDLREMRRVITETAPSDEDRRAALAGVDALLETLPPQPTGAN